MNNSALLLFATTFGGAFGLYLASRNQDLRPFSFGYAFNLNIGKDGRPPVVALDAIVTSIFGATVAYIVAQPVTNMHALTAGLSFTGIINANAKHYAQIR